MQNRNVLADHKRLLGVLAAAASLLSVPVVAHLITGGFGWDEADFFLAALLLFGTALAFEAVARRGSSALYSLASGLSLLTALFLVWANLAVGIIGNEGNPANLMYYGVLVIGVIVAAVGRMRPEGMARALFSMAAAQLLVSFIALQANLGFSLYVDSFFAFLWTSSGLLFRYAARKA